MSDSAADNNDTQQQQEKDEEKKKNKQKPSQDGELEQKKKMSMFGQKPVPSLGTSYINEICGQRRNTQESSRDNCEF